MKQLQEEMEQQFSRLLEEPEYANLQEIITNALHASFAAGWYSGKNDDKNPLAEEETKK